MTKTKSIILLPALTSLADFILSMLPPPFCFSRRFQNPISFMNLFLIAPTPGDLFLEWTHDIYLTTYFALSSFVLLLHYYLTRMSPRLDSKPFEAQQSFSTASWINGSPSLFLFSVLQMSIWVSFFSGSSSCLTLA